MPLSRIISLKIDVDTYRGLKEGVPVLLDIMARLSVKGTFFVSFGPDNSGKAIRNIFKKGFLRKMLRTKAGRIYGLRTMLYGTLLPAPVISEKRPDIIKSIADQGHEVGVHAWDHWLWQDKLDKLPEEKIKGEFEKSFAAFRRILGCEPKCTAAPAWFCNRKSLEIQDTLNLDYSSDTRLGKPFYPRIEDRTFQTLQIPGNQPCIEELIGTGGVNEENIVDRQISMLSETAPNVISVHAEVEGGMFRNQFAGFLQRTLDSGYRFTVLKDISKTFRNAPVADLTYVTLPGRSGIVSAPKSNR